ncbi:hypothetical protein F0562_017699 [Nyssa sinensis]|uniref:Uncharacterized protein n=1 Tax=Nyssa sinensis TaxID=561372 RepID=A0A5J4ZIJ0_9ASTE|nr:hypothetical protein F0562_017699 [Nyssa sinensis]
MCDRAAVETVKGGVAVIQRNGRSGSDKPEGYGVPVINRRVELWEKLREGERKMRVAAAAAAIQRQQQWNSSRSGDNGGVQLVVLSGVVAQQQRVLLCCGSTLVLEEEELEGIRSRLGVLAVSGVVGAAVKRVVGRACYYNSNFIRSAWESRLSHGGLSTVQCSLWC